VGLGSYLNKYRYDYSAAGIRRMSHLKMLPMSIIKNIFSCSVNPHHNNRIETSYRRTTSMKLLPLLQATLFAVGRQHPTTWIIDGNNLLAHRGTPIDRDVLAKKLEPIRGAEEVVLVFDGRPGEATSVDSEGTLRKVSLGEGLSADDYIQQEIADLLETMPRRRIQVVTADRELRRSVLEQKAIVRGVVNPVTFWRRYLPRLCGLK
jgi:hypothetical protein